MCDLGHGEAPGVLLVRVLDDDAERLHQLVGREHVAARPERHHASCQQQHLVVFDRLGDVVGGRDDGGTALQLGREGIEIALASTGVDAGGRELYLDAFAAELQRGAAMVTATHDIAEAVEYDQVLLLARRVVALGAGRDVLTPDQLMETFGIVIQDPHEEHAGRFTVAEVAHGGPQTIDTRCRDDEDCEDEPSDTSTA